MDVVVSKFYSHFSVLYMFLLKRPIQDSKYVLIQVICVHKSKLRKKICLSFEW